MKPGSGHVNDNLFSVDWLSESRLHNERTVAGRGSGVSCWPARLACAPRLDTVPVHFLHIRKTGGTAVAEALRPIASRYGLVLHDHGTTLRDIPCDHFVVFFVRHPIPRFVSGFCSRQRQGLPRHHFKWNAAEAEAFRHFNTPNDLAEALSATDPDRAAHARQAMRDISHVKSTYRDWFAGEQEIDERLESIALVGLQETLSSDFECVKQWLGLPEDVSLPSDDTLAHRTPSSFDRRLSAMAERNLVQWYADDIRFYDHCVQLRAARGL